MNKYAHFFIIGCLPLFFVLTNCSSPSKEIKKAFETVNESLKKSNARTDQSITGLYKTINANRQKDEKLGLKADSVFIVFNTAFAFMDSLKQVLHEADTSGERLDLSTKLLVNSASGKRLMKLLLTVDSQTSSYFADTPNTSLDNTLGDIRMIKTYAKWQENYFERTPTIGAMTILSKFQNDCIEAIKITLDAIKQRLVK